MQNFSIAIYFPYSEGNASCIAMRPEWKVSSLLEEGRVLHWADMGAGCVVVKISWFSNANAALAKAYVEGNGYEALSVEKRLSTIKIEMLLQEVSKVARESWVRRIKPEDPPQVLNNGSGSVLGGGNYLGLRAALGGRGLTGRGVRIGLWDGNVENHVDFGNRLHVLEF